MVDLASLPLLQEGTTEGVIELRRSEKGVFVIAMLAGPLSKNENRWTLPFTRALHKAYDAVEDALGKDKKHTPAALLLVSTSPKFFSNGIDVEWFMSPKTTDSERSEWNALVMPCFARPILLPIPTVCAIGGHTFGAGLMGALGYDYRMQAKGKGFLCAPEAEINVPIPTPELTLFRHDMPANAFHQTVLAARRWTAEAAFSAGVIHQVCEGDQLLSDAMAYAEQRAKATARSRKGMSLLKKQTKGCVAKEIFDFNYNLLQENKAVVPASLLRHAEQLREDTSTKPSSFPWAMSKL